jgi:GrpB-like predicted nucleotidyltransferase (UPF0157 family)
LTANCRQVLEQMAAIVDDLGDANVDTVPPLSEANSPSGIVNQSVAVVDEWIRQLVNRNEVEVIHEAESRAVRTANDLATATRDAGERLTAAVQRIDADTPTSRDTPANCPVAATPDPHLADGTTVSTLLPVLVKLTQHLGRLELLRELLTERPTPAAGHNDVRLVAYRTSWVDEFLDASRSIAATVGDLLDGGIEHIGSTAIPGMIAKPQIDMLAPVRDLADARAAAPLLAGLGYASRPHRVDAVLYVEPGDRVHDPNATYRRSLHLTTRDSELWTERLLFRETLRADPLLRDAYIDLKLAMLAQPEPYTSRNKRDFVRHVLAVAGHELRDGLRTNPGKQRVSEGARQVG